MFGVEFFLDSGALGSRLNSSGFLRPEFPTRRQPPELQALGWVIVGDALNSFLALRAR